MASPLGFDALKSILHRRIDTLPDHRKAGPNTRYRVQDAALGAFGIFFTQSPSFRVPTPSSTNQGTKQCLYDVWR